MNGVT